MKKTVRTIELTWETTTNFSLERRTGASGERGEVPAPDEQTDGQSGPNELASDAGETHETD